ncbi:hypothetical protein ACVWXQ_003428 [Bradyrhizobium sp. S3.14.4]
MNHFNASRQPVQAQRPNTAPGNAEARKVAEQLMDSMNALLGLVERETELVRAGQVREAMTLESKKQELSRNYVSAVSELKTNQAQLAKSAPELLSTLHRHHDAFRAMLQVNLTVLATAHAVSESVVRGVNAEIQKRNVPNTYTAGGTPRGSGPTPHHPARGQPLALSTRENSLQFYEKPRGDIVARLGTFAYPVFNPGVPWLRIERGWDLTQTRQPGGCHEYRFQHQAGGDTGPRADHNDVQCGGERGRAN